MKNIFAHMADIHLDSPLQYLNDSTKIENRRIEHKKAFKDAILSIKEKECKFILISGDLFDGEVADVTTMKYVDDVFKMVEDVKIIIIAGNHDLYNQNTLIYNYPYTSKNVVVLKDYESVIVDDVKIYSNISNDETLDNNYYNILMWHGDVNESGQINPLPFNLKNKGFDYIALGHIHQYSDLSTLSSKIYYPGCFFARGFDELDEKGYLLAEYSKLHTNVTFNVVAQRLFKEIEVDVTNLDYESIISLSNSIKNKITNPSDFYKIVLKGSRNIANKINKTFLINELSNYAYFVKVKDITTYQNVVEESLIEKIFIEKINQRLKEALNENEVSLILKAKEIGLKALRNEVIFDEDM